MAWIKQHKRLWRVAILFLLLLALLGPWSFDRVVVPAKYTCSAPFVRLTGDYCGTPLSGMWILAAVGAEFKNVVVRLAAGATTLADVGRLPLVILLVLLPLLSFVSTALLILPGDDKRKGVFHRTVWGLAVAPIVWLLLAAGELPPRQLWGLWLYIGLVPSVLILEVVLVIRRRAGQER